MDRLLIPTAAALVLLGGSATHIGGADRIARSGPAPDTIPAALGPIGSEHVALLSEFARVMRRATAPAATAADRLALVNYLRGTLIPHAQREELVLYPALDSVLKTRGYATATLVLDHRAIARLTLELANLAPNSPDTFQRRALTVEALVTSHFDKEEQFVLPLLGRHMKDQELRALLARMEAQRVPS